MVLLRYAHERYTQSLLYREDRDGDGVREGEAEGPPAGEAGDTRPA
jgi:hypothetical protein